MPDLWFAMIGLLVICFCLSEEKDSDGISKKYSLAQLRSEIVFRVVGSALFWTGLAAIVQGYPARGSTYHLGQIAAFLGVLAVFGWTLKNRFRIS